MYIRHANGIESSGEVVEVEPPRRFVFTYGFNSGNPMPPGSSLVTISLEPAGAATRLQLVHDFAEASPRDEHVQGWRYQLSVFANVVTNLANARAAGHHRCLVQVVVGKGCRIVVARRSRQIAISDVQVRDRFSLLEGIDDLVRHIGATQRFMPDMHLLRRGEVRHCQGTLLVGWAATNAAGEERGTGTNVFTLRGDGKIESVTGFWDPPEFERSDDSTQRARRARGTMARSRSRDQ